MSEKTPPDAALVSQRTMEIVVAAAAFVFGAIVAIDSLRLGAGWADDGPQAGYFPFYVGLIVCAASAWHVVSTLRWRVGGDEAFVLRGQWRQILALLIPSIVYVAAIRLLGIYLASALFIGYFMARHGAHRAWVTVAVALGLPAVLFCMFELWFRTPLPKGPIEAMLGLH